MEVVYNACHGGFSVSEYVVDRLGLLDCRAIARTDPRLIELLINEGSKKCSGECAELKILDTETRWFEIREYDGYETVICYKVKPEYGETKEVRIPG